MDKKFSDLPVGQQIVGWVEPFAKPIAVVQYMMGIASLHPSYALDLRRRATCNAQPHKVRFAKIERICSSVANSPRAISASASARSARSSDVN
jgi:hypothetical protein